jgi:hypothetical protein
MKNILYVLIGAGAMFAILKVMKKQIKQSSQSQSESDETGELVIKVLSTDQARNLVLSPQFKALMKTDEFKKLYSVLGTRYLTALANTLI